MAHGTRVEYLLYSPFLFGSPGVEQLNFTILTQTEEDICEGGSDASQSLSKVYLQENKVIKGVPSLPPLWIKKEMKRDTSWTYNRYSMHSLHWRRLSKALMGRKLSTFLVRESSWGRLCPPTVAVQADTSLNAPRGMKHGDVLTMLLGETNTKM